MWEHDQWIPMPRPSENQKQAADVLFLDGSKKPL
jgi:hypothetical protein